MTLRVTPQDLAALQRTTERIRNICILAHVDHGKTTLSDSLVSANGIISEKLAGKIRYLDNTEEEQTRGITMKSSAISLLFMNEPNANATTANPSEGDADAATVPYLINLVDSPGHVDFSFDVSTAVRLCDGALVLIDAVEGVCAQTIAVIRQAWQEGIRPCLIINKMDRLIFELQLTPYEACERLNRIMEQANAVLSALIRSEVLAKHDAADETGEGGEQKDEEKKEEKEIDHEAITNEVTAMENELLFSPVNGNVLFASAADGWAFNIGFFAHLYAKKLELPFRAMRQGLWGDHYYNAKTKKIVTKAPTSNSQTMFCSFILDPIWKTYNQLSAPVSSDADLEALRKLTKQLRVAKLVTDRDLKHGDRKSAIQAVMRKWLPLANTVLKMVTRALPNPVVAQQKRAAKLCGFAEVGKEIVIPVPQKSVYSSMEKCDTVDEAPVVVFICKIISVEANVLSDFHQQGLSGDDPVYVAMGRVYSGVLRTGAPVYVLDPKFQGLPDGIDLEASEEEIMKHVKHVSRLGEGQLRTYMMMGRELHALSEVPAGNIVGIVGLQEHVLKTATLSSTIRCPSLTRMPYQAKPIVRVAVEPEDPRNFAALEAGLQRLYRSDPTVEVQVQETGEHVIVALGELHLERCIKDLKERFAKVAIRVSEPLVGFRESVADDTTSSPSAQQSVVFRELLATSQAPIASEVVAGQQQQQEDPKVASGTTQDGSMTLKVRALPLPRAVATFLEEHSDELRVLVESRKNHDGEEAASEELVVEDADGASSDDDTSAIATTIKASVALSFGQRLEELLRASENDAFWKNLPLDRIWSFGPRRVGPNVLINNISDYKTATNLFSSTAAPVEEHRELLRKLESSIVTGFQMTTNAGPLCDEPVWGVAFVVDDVISNERKEEEGSEDTAVAAVETDNSAASFKFGPISGQIMSTMRTACRVAFIKQPVRLVEAVYECTVQCLAEQLGKLYSVIAKRRGDVFSEELSDGSALFTIKAHLPVVESFGFATDLLIQTSGAASNPQLVFSHWAVMDMDPYFQPQTEEEREDWGERVYDHNYVRKYIEAVRKRKGLARDEKIVVHAEKQRTLARKR